MATLSQISSPVWSLSIGGSGGIAEGLAAIRQAIHIILTTSKGSDPMRPEFGSDVYKYVDMPLSIAIPNVKKAIIDAIGIWEPRVRVTSVRHTLIGDSNLVFEINYLVIDDNLNDSIDIIPSVLTQPLQLQGIFPPNPNGYRYLISGFLNSNSILPLAPETGFATPDEIYNWVRTNWAGYGRWYLNADRIVGYINAGYTTGSLTISLLAKVRFAEEIPVLPAGKYYTISITVDGVTESESTADLLTSSAALRDWAQEKFGELGTWTVDNVGGDYNEDYNNDYNIYSEQLAIVTDQAESVTITINTAP